MLHINYISIHPEPSKNKNKFIRRRSKTQKMQQPIFKRKGNLWRLTQMLNLTDKGFKEAFIFMFKNVKVMNEQVGN